MRPITEFPALAPGQLALGADNNIWYATGDTSIGRISPTGVVTVFEIGYGMRISAIAAGIDGKIWWLNDTTADELVGRVALDGTGAESQPLPMQYSGPVGITAGPGAMWFTQSLSRQIGSVTSTWAFNEFSLDGQITGDFAIVDGPDGNLWFTTSTNSICRVTPDGVPTCFPCRLLRTQARPYLRKESPSGRTGTFGSPALNPRPTARPLAASRPRVA